MTKYDFDYYVKRIEVLNEMARPSPLTKMGEHGIVGKQLLDQVGKIMKLGNITDSNGENVPGLPLNVHKNRVLRYFLYMLNEGEDIEDDIDSEPEESGNFSRSKDGMVNLSKRLLGIPLDEKAKDYGYMTSDALYRAAIMKSIENDPQYVMSSEFREKVLDTTTIADYMKQGRVATHSSYSVNKATEQEQKYGASIEDIHSAQMDIKDIISKIHRAMGYKKRSLSNKPQEETSPSTISNDYTENIQNILKTLEELAIFKNILDKITSISIDVDSEDDDQRGKFIKAIQFNQMLQNPLSDAEIASLAILERDKTGNTIIEDLIEQFSDLKDTGIPIEQFKEEINDIMSYTPQEVHPVLNLIINDVTSSEDKSDKYPGYDSEILKKYITTSEEKEAFERYYQWYINNMYDKLEKAKEAAEYAKAGYEEYKGMLPELRRNYNEFLKKWNDINKAKDKEYVKSLKVDDDDDTLSKYGLSKDDISDDYIASRIPKNESYIMNYMTEQISKDRFKPKGEFKSRGFKRMNYVQWLERNS